MFFQGTGGAPVRRGSGGSGSGLSKVSRMARGLSVCASVRPRLFVVPRKVKFRGVDRRRFGGFWFGFLGKVALDFRQEGSGKFEAEAIVFGVERLVTAGVDQLD